MKIYVVQRDRIVSQQDGPDYKGPGEPVCAFESGDDADEYGARRFANHVVTEVTLVPNSKAEQPGGVET